MGTDRRVAAKHGFGFGLVILALAFLFLSAPEAVAQSTGKTVHHHKVQERDVSADELAQAEGDIERGDYANAEILLKKYLEAQSENYAAWYDLGFLYHQLGRREESIAAYRKSVSSKSSVFESNLNLGLALADSGDPQAEQFLRAATKLNPTSNAVQGHTRAWLALGRLLETTKPDDAIAAFEQAANLDPKNPEPHLEAGPLFERRQKPGEAEREYQHAISIAPDSSDALVALSNLYMREKRFDDAQASLRRLVALHPNDASAHFQLGRILSIAGKNEDATSEIEAGLKLDPSDRKAQRDLADLDADLQKYDRAAQIYSVLITENPNDADLHAGFGRVLMKQKKFAEAEQELIKAAELKPGSGEIYGELAVAANENKNYPLAIKAADLRAEYLPENPMSYFLRATAYDHLRDAKDAAKYYHQFLEVAGGKYPDQEWQAKHRLIAIEPKK
jgi:tetratricopeptide (TPR) repeat protein